MTLTSTPTRRERQRAATVEEIKEVARGLMRHQGITDVRFTDIAKEMGMTAPALYRYYADRDALLTDLIADGYRDLGRVVAEAREQVDADNVAARWIAAGRAYRDWARREPAQFALILGMPVPGYVAPEEGPTTDAAKDAMSQLSALFIRAAELGDLKAPLVTDVSDAMAACAAEKHPELSGLVPPASFQAMITAWATLHGATCLDAYGQFDWLGDEARDQLFEATLRTAALAAGFPIE
ncbi:TetR/AcrR family transcriptional regulator [Nocardioides agariphilus]|uniref:TetR/AcrR family transcriptional regulator n=1 Tax=Nocardioides agariphilus TaxID=433664 RepID=A0A930VMA6_9ACTN|nr:TetR/AcrR family transcriptional regulator [Nocardioides agariphilus]